MYMYLYRCISMYIWIDVCTKESDVYTWIDVCKLSFWFSNGQMFSARRTSCAAVSKTAEHHGGRAGIAEGYMYMYIYMQDSGARAQSERN